MAKTVTVSKAEYEYLQETIKNDGLTIAQLQTQLEQAKEDIRNLLVSDGSYRSCEYCKMDQTKCACCETDAEWRGCLTKA